MYVCLFVILAMMKTQLGSNVNATDVPCLRLALISCQRLTWSRPCCFKMPKMTLFQWVFAFFDPLDPQDFLGVHNPKNR